MNFYFNNATYVVRNPAAVAAVYVLMAIFTGAWMVGFWLYTGVIRDARASGYRFWLLDPRAMLAGLRVMKWRLYVLSMLIGLLAFAAMWLIGFFASEPL